MWFKEFIVNVIVQMFHAVVYLVITGSAVKSFVESGGGNALFLILCVLFLFEGEKILRAIFNMKSKAHSISDLAASGAMIWGLARNAGGMLKRDKDDVGNEEDKKDSKEASSRMKNRKNTEKERNTEAINALEAKKENDEGEESFGEYQGEDNEPEGVSHKEYDGAAAQDTVLGKAMKKRLKAGIATKSVNFVAGAAGATLLTTQALADGKTDPGEALGAISAGKNLGKMLANPITFATNKGEQLLRGHMTARAIRNGEMDKSLGLGNIGNVTKGDITDKDFEDKMDSQQEIYRKALEAYAKAAARGGKARGEIAYYNYLERNLKD